MLTRDVMTRTFYRSLAASAASHRSYSITLGGLPVIGEIGDLVGILIRSEESSKRNST